MAHLPVQLITSNGKTNAVLFRDLKQQQPSTRRRKKNEIDFFSSPSKNMNALLTKIFVLFGQQLEKEKCMESANLFFEEIRRDYAFG